MPQSQAQPIDLPRESPIAVNDNMLGAGRCPICNAPASSASEYRGKGVIHHHWLCRSCGHKWITVLHVQL
jgi:transposase-like protein